MANDPYIDRNGEVFDPDFLRAEMERLGEEWADLNAAATFLEDSNKSVLAEISLYYKAEGVATSAIDCERHARASPQFRQHIKDEVEARRKANRARVRYDAVRAYNDLLRTRMATERAVASMR